MSHPAVLVALSELEGVRDELNNAYTEVLDVLAVQNPALFSRLSRLVRQQSALEAFVVVKSGS